ncbi:MAG: CAP domain-containing protein [bacterium]|nr:CAP domain-containing protein [bacterium]
MKTANALLAWLTIFAAAPAQGKASPGEGAPSAPLAVEIPVHDLGRKELNAFAVLCEKNGFSRRAREIWFEVIGEYSADDEQARKALGFFRVGQVWNVDPDFDYSPVDRLDAGAAKTLARRFEVVRKKIGRSHVEVAKELVAAGNDDRAEHHFRRALRFLPNDPEVIAVAGLQQYEGIIGSPTELGILRRSRLMDREITELVAKEYSAEAIAADLPIFAKLGIELHGCKTENFRVYGDWDPAILAQAAAWAERSLAFCDVAFEGHLSMAPGSRLRRTFVFLKDRDTWIKLIEKNVAIVGHSHAVFLAENASAGLIGSVHTAGFPHIETVFDLAVRWVVHDYTAFEADALRAGIGHAVVGMFFGRNLVFAVGQIEEKRTVASRTKAKLLLPDIDTWMQLATEIAWSRTSTPAARLPQLDAASFPTDGRIKAWSFCDYLLRRDPKLLVTLDHAGREATTDGDVLAAFAERAHRPLGALEDGWRRFWTEDSPVKRAIVDRSTPLEATSRDAAKWLEAFNRARAELGRRPVGWSADLSRACKQHADYLVKNRDQRGPAREHTQLASKPGYSNAGRSFAQTAVIWTGRDPKKAMARWLLIPGYRDALLNRNIDVVGIYAARGVMVLDARRGRVPSETAWNITFPVPESDGRSKAMMPRAVDVALLGPEVERLLAKNGRKGQKQVGLPISAHLYFGALGNVKCRVTAKGDLVAGYLVPGSGRIGRTSAEGLWVFYPAEPLPKGGDIAVEWTWDGGGAKVRFAVK